MQRFFGIVHLIHLKYKTCITKKAKKINLINDHFPLKFIKIKHISHFNFTFTTREKLKSISTSTHAFKSSGGSRISPRWGRQTSGGGTNIRFCQIFPKLHKIERIWTPGALSATEEPQRRPCSTHTPVK